MNKTPIEWIFNPDGSRPGWSWNPITGCLNGCEYCYARKLANGRLKPRYLANKNWDTRTPQGYEGYPNLDPFYPRFWEDRLWKPAHRFRDGNGKGIFVCDMSDLFGIGVPEEWTQRVMNIICVHQYHRFYLLTKQPQNLIKFSPFPDNCYVGVTATNHTMLIEAKHYLEGIEAATRFVSLEPLLEWHTHRELDWLVEVLKSINWLIIGAQTRPTVYPKIEWVREIVEACDKAGVKVFLKNNLKPLIDAYCLYPDRGLLYSETFPVSKLRQEMPEGKGGKYDNRKKIRITWG